MNELTVSSPDAASSSIRSPMEKYLQVTPSTSVIKKKRNAADLADDEPSDETDSANPSAKQSKTPVNKVKSPITKATDGSSSKRCFCYAICTSYYA